jgi:uncharacterized protein (TIGR00730 family)
MTTRPYRGELLDDAHTDGQLAAAQPDTPQTRSPTYRLAYQDGDFMVREGLRPLRFQMELLKPEVLLDDAGVLSTFVIYGSARIRDDGAGAPHAMQHHYAEARELARLASGFPAEADGTRHFVVCSGGGPSIMEAANRGAADAGRTSIGLNIVLPMEQAPNAFVSPDLCFQFHYFALRKMHFILRARAVAVFPGGFGTLDELFDLLTLMQTGKMAVIPVLLFDEPFWRRTIGFDALVESGMIAARDMDLIRFVPSAADAWAAVDAFYRQHPDPLWHKRKPVTA